MKFSFSFHSYRWKNRLEMRTKIYCCSIHRFVDKIIIRLFGLDLLCYALRTNRLRVYIPLFTIIVTVDRPILQDLHCFLVENLGILRVNIKRYKISTKLHLQKPYFLNYLLNRRYFERKKMTVAEIRIEK